jgi:predicted MFS family arabinose efflux permease
LLLFFYFGFLVGTLCCGLAPTYETLLAARVVTGIFGGVIGSVSLAIVTDLFPFNVRGRVMGFVQMAFAVAQVAGIPFGIYLANMFDWHAPFLLIVALGVPLGLTIARFVKPVDLHLQLQSERNAFAHLLKTVSVKPYVLAFGTTALLSIGGFMLMPFTSAFVVDNLMISQDDLPKVFIWAGVCSMVLMPLIGRVSDKFGKLRTFVVGTIISAAMVVVYTNLPPVPLWELVVVNAVLFSGIMSRMIPAQALMTAIPEAADRGAFMGVMSSLQQIAGGVASLIAGFIVVQRYEGAPLEHFDMLGYVVIGVMAVALVLMYYVNALVKRKMLHAANPPHRQTQPTSASEI